MTTIRVASTSADTWRIAAVLGLSVPLLLWAASIGPLPQPLQYHDFADQGGLYGIPHFWNVVSNLPFAVIGLIGSWWLFRTGARSAAIEPGERAAYVVFYLGAVLTGFGSAYYHAGPANETLVWDRLALSLMLTSFFAIVLGEFVSRRLGRQILAPAIVLGIVSVLYWAYTESVGRGDMRLYLLVQFYPIVSIPVVLLLFRSRSTHAGTFWLVWALYGVAKLAEIYDRPILEWTGVCSGHTVKHLIAAGASLVPLYGLQRDARIRG